MAEPLFADEYRAARVALTEETKSSQGLVLVVSMVLFGFSISTGSAIRQILITVAVLVLHELGHYVGMRAFGYRDVRMFFIPFFGAAVSGKPRGVAAWKDGIVSLLGPLPGIFVALALSLVWRPPSPALRDVVNTLLFINVLNLLPLGGFDGARFLQRVLFSRHRHLEVGFLAVAGLALLGIALSQRMWVLAIFAYFVLVLVPLRHRILRAAHDLRDRLAGATEAKDLDDDRGHMLFLAARAASHAQNRSKPKVVAAAMDQIVEATRPPPSALATVGLLAAWLIGLSVAVVAFLAMAKPSAAKPFEDFAIPGGGFVVSLPHDAKRTTKPPKDGAVSIEELKGESGPVYYQVNVETTPEAFPDAIQAGILEANLKKKPELVDGPVEPITQAGLTGRSLTLKGSSGSERCRASYLFDGARTITLMACASGPEPKLDGLLESFRRAP